MSSGSPRWVVRMARPSPGRISSVRWARTASVMIRPGTMVLTRMSCLPWEVATYMVRVLTPALDTP